MGLEFVTRRHRSVRLSVRPWVCGAATPAQTATARPCGLTVSPVSCRETGGGWGMGTLECPQLHLLLRGPGSASWAGRGWDPGMGPQGWNPGDGQGPWSGGCWQEPRGTQNALCTLGFPHYHKTFISAAQLCLSWFPLPPAAFPGEAKHRQTQGGEVPSALPSAKVTNPKQGSCACCITPSLGSTEPPSSSDRAETGGSGGTGGSGCSQQSTGTATMLCPGLGRVKGHLERAPGEGRQDLLPPEGR